MRVAGVRPGLGALGLALVVAVAGVVIPLEVGGRAPAPTVVGALAARSAAEGAGDVAAAERLIAPGSGRLAADERTAVAALGQLRFSVYGYRLLSLTGAGAQRTAVVRLAYALAGFDPQPLTATETDTYDLRGGRWLLAARAAVTPEIWAYGPLTVVRTAHALVIGTAAAGAPAVAAEVDRDVPAVTAAWGTDWPQRAVVLLPTTTAQVAALAGESGDLRAVAAVESTERVGGESSGARITVNRSAWARLSAVGRRVIMTHELTHVASRAATTASSPTWLVEGLADAVGFAGSGLPAAAIDAELAADVRAGRIPTALPADAAYAAGGTDLAATYEQGWLACRLLESRVGVAGLVAFYHRVGGSGLAPPAAVDAALRSTAHLDTPQFTALWLASVRAAG